MNFFEHQDKARRQTRWLVFLFILAVTGIIVAVNAVVLAVLGVETLGTSASLGQFVSANGPAMGASTLITGSVIGLASLFRTLQLRGGGAEIARELGGTLVEPDTRDPLRRRLRNVVEEMAIASGIPVPEIYVLEHEQGINAFAAGFNTADAAVAVTRGTLENLSRDELQGVIAHEFSHIFNGDTRINIRLIGILFGILVISIIGRKLLRSASYARDSRNAAPAVFIGLAVVIIGYVGLFFGRWIKAAVSRQREYLADASAVQFTRDPGGIGGALKKIAASYAGSFMTTDAEEVGHMLFARGMGYQMFATHPPIEERILAIDPSFKPAELKDLAKEMDRHAQSRQAKAELAEQEQVAESDKPKGPGGLPLDPDQIAEQIGQPGLNQIFVAAALTAAIPPVLERAAHSDEWSQEVICALLLSRDSEIRETQLLAIARALGSDSEAQVRALHQAMPEVRTTQHLPLMEMAFPALRRRPPAELVRFMGLVDELIQADGKIEVFEYVLARLTSRQIEDVLNPKRASYAGSKKLERLREQATELLAIVAAHGHDDAEQAARAFSKGYTELFNENGATLPALTGWTERLDVALKSLDGLRMNDKQQLMAALVTVVMHDGKVTPPEYELVRVICGALHVPLPVLESIAPDGATG
ncbi:MAG: M48 family metallopeptidase [Pseudomonadota bacterium]